MDTLHKMLKILILFIALLFFSKCDCKILLHTVEGEVTAENFTYWSLTYIGNLLLIVNSTVGDVDIYVSETLSKPGFEPNTYDLHSATCGVDFVEIPKNFKRPIGVGLYGHFLHNVSQYILEVYLDTDKKIDRWNNDEISFTDKSNKANNHNSNNFRSKLRTILARSGFWTFLEIFEMIFL